MNPRNILPILCCLLLASLAPGKAFSQDLTADEGFFKGQKQVYQDWLNLSGLGEVLKVYEVTVKPDAVFLYLDIPATFQNREQKTDYVLSAWNELRARFRENNSISLESQLFLKMLHIMELEPQQAAVLLFDTYDPYETPLYYAVFYKQEQITVDSTVFRSTSHSVQVYVPPVAESAQSELAVGKAPAGQYAGLFRKISEFFNRRFDPAKVQITEKLADYEKGVYVISLKPLYKEVLKDQQNLLVCQWLNRLGFDCNTLKKEWLTFTFNVIPTDFGYKLDCLLEGKCSESSSAWSGRGSFRDIDNDEYSREVLQDYGDWLMGELRRFLE